MTDQKRDVRHDIWVTRGLVGSLQSNGRTSDSVLYVRHSDLVAAGQHNMGLARAVEQESCALDDVKEWASEEIGELRCKLAAAEQRAEKYREALTMLLEEINAAPLAVHGGQRDIDRFELALRVAREFAGVATG